MPPPLDSHAVSVRLLCAEPQTMASNRGKSSGLGFWLFQPPPKSMDYLTLSMRPFHILVFLLPFVALYEIGSVIYLHKPTQGMTETIGAHAILSGFFNTFGVASFHIPSLVLLVVLLSWHIVEKDSFGLRFSTLTGMFAESVLWTLPLLVFGLLFQTHTTIPGLMGALMPQDLLTSMSWQEKLTLSAGAGVYEELVFRFLLITTVHFIVVDLLGGSKGVALTIGAAVSAIAFALYHNISHPGGGIDLRLLIYFSVAGLYFAALFIMRGLGIAVAAHFLYDAVVLLVIHRAWPPD